MNDEQLRRLLTHAAEPAWDDEVRATSALYAGQRRSQQRHRRGLLVGGLAVAAAGAAVLVVLVPTGHQPQTDMVLGCAQGSGTTGSALLAAGVSGVTVAVHNPTSEVQSVAGGGTTVLAVPGDSQVTLPLTAGTSTIRCGAGRPVRLTIEQLSAESHCTSVLAGLEAAVQRGAPVDLTRGHLGDLPSGAVVDAVGADPLQRVQVRSSGRVVAEAVWHAMPGQDDWQLESLSRCR